MEKNMSDGMRARSMGQICCGCQCHQRPAWRWGGSHPFQTRRRTLDALPEAPLQTHPERSRHRQREILFSHFKNKKSDKISRKRRRLSHVQPCSALLLVLGHDVTLLWGQGHGCCAGYGGAGAQGMKGCSLAGSCRESEGASWICRSRAAARPCRSHHRPRAAWLAASA